MRDLSVEFLSSLEPRPSAQDLEKIHMSRERQEYLKPYLDCCRSVLQDSITELNASAKANADIADENIRLRNALVREMGGTLPNCLHDIAASLYNEVRQPVDKLWSSSLEKLSKDAQQDFLVTDLGEPLPTASRLQRTPHSNQPFGQESTNGSALGQAKGINRMIMTAKPFANMVDRFEGGFQQAEHTFPGAMPVTLPTACGAQTCSSPPSLALACPRSGEQTQPSWAVCPPQDAHSDFSRGWRASAPFPPAKESFDCGLVHSEQYMYPSVPLAAPNMLEATTLLSTPRAVQNASASMFAPFPAGHGPSNFLGNSATQGSTAEKTLCKSEPASWLTSAVDDNLQGWIGEPCDVSPQSTMSISEFEESRAVASDDEDEISNLPVPPGSNTKPARTLPTGVTTIVVRNIPARFSQEKLMEVWPPDGSYNLFYLPYSFQRRRRSGIAFINMVSHEAAVEFTARWHGQKVADIGSSKRLDISVAEIQGFAGNLKHLKASNIRRISNQHFLPMAFKGTKKLDFKALLAQENLEEFDGERLESAVVE